MNTKTLTNREGGTFGFMIENVYISNKKVVELLRSASGVANIKVRKWFTPNPDIHVEFSYMGREFMVWEPHGDSSTYWICPREETNENINVSALESVFQVYRPPLLIKIFGDLISFKFLAPLKTLFRPQQQK